MKFIIAWSTTVALLLQTPTDTLGFVPRASNARSQIHMPLLDSKSNTNHDDQSISSWLGKVATTAAITASLWGAPSVVAENVLWNIDASPNQIVSSYVASAKEMASGTGSRVNKDADSLLRLGLPIQNKEVREAKIGLEDSGYMSHRHPPLDALIILASLGPWFTRCLGNG